jgi:hypothetical protein
MSGSSSDAHSRLIDKEDEMLFYDYEATRAEAEYRRTRITEMYRRANRRRVRQPEQAPKSSAGRGLVKVRPAD